MRVHYYDSYPNFGDQLNKYLWAPYFQPWLSRASADDITLLGVGTLLGEADYGPGRLLVCGAGFGYRAETAALRCARAHVCFVRGPLSARVLGLDASYAVTDPAALVPRLFAPAARSDRVLWVPHWETAANPLWRKACALADIDYADPRHDVSKVLAQISRARLVLAESLHAAICADAYRVPWVPVLTSPRINAFKWHDWLRSLELQARFESLPQLGLSDVARRLQQHPQLAAALTETLQDFGAELPAFGETLLSRSFERWLHAKPQLRARVLHTLLWRIGPKLDALTEPTPALERAAAALQRVAASAGYLSGAAVQQAALQRLDERIHAAQAWLRSCSLH
ncbi:MAG TPA: polysaccharide pyruvyl transferase family protein [Polyangiales bacterium]|nr:polysaccharide pyruvyl transferase family protein [Polyangiales bacterium]